MIKKHFKTLSIIFVIFLITISSKNYAADATWKVEEGSWSTGSNWNTGTPPNSAGDTATFGSDSGSPPYLPTITVDEEFATVGSIIFNSQNHGFFIEQTTGNLTLDNGGDGATISVSGTENFVISAPITLSDDLTINVSGYPGPNFNIEGVISGNHNVTFNNTSNTIQFFSASNTYTGTTSITGNGIALTGDGSINLSSAVSISSGAMLTIDVGTSFSNYTFNDLTGGGTLFLANKTAIIPSGDFSGIIEGGPNAKVEKTSGGTLILTGANTYRGGTTVSGGTLQGDTKGLQENISTANSTFVKFDQDFTGTYEGVMSGGGALVKSNKGTVILTGMNNYTGGTTVSTDGGILQGDTNSLKGRITNDATVTFDQTFTGTYEDVIRGMGTLIKSGTGEVILSGVNTYDGGTTINAGTLTLSTTGSLAPTGAVHLSGENTVFDVTESTSNQTIGDLTGSATSQILLGSNPLTFGTTNPTAQTFGGAISGSGSLVKQGTGTANLSGMNTYVGGTTINEGTLTLSTTGSLLAAGAVYLSGENTVFDVTASTIAQTIGDLTGVASSQILLGSNQLTFGTNTSSQTFGGAISGSGSLVKRGTGIANLSGVNTYNGGTTINAGTLTFSTTGSLAPTGAVHLSGENTVFDVTASTIAQTIGDLTGVASSQILLGSNQLTFGTNTSSQTFNGVISGSDGKIVKHGMGTVILKGDNSYTGGTTISGGTLQGSTASLNAPITNNGTVVFDQGVTRTYSGVISGEGALINKGLGTVILSGVNTYSKGSTITAGGLGLSGTGSLLAAGAVHLSGENTVFDVTASTINQTIGDLTGSATSQILLGSNQLTFGTNTSSQTFGGAISGSGSIVKQGTGTATLSGVNTYAGGTTINTGTLALSGAGSLVSTGAVQLSAGTTFDLTTSTIDQTIGDLTGPTTSQILLGSNQLTFGTNTSSQTFSGIVSGSGGVVKQGTGIANLSGVNTYDGGTTINAGTLTLSTTGSLFAEGAVHLSGENTVFDVTESTSNQTIGDLTGVASSQILLGSNQLTFGTNTSSQTFNGVISGSDGKIVKHGTGTVILKGDNSYTGGTTISGGTLQGSTASLNAPITNNGTVVFDQGVTRTYSGVISGEGALINKGLGTVILSGVNTYSKGSTITAGGLGLSGIGSLAPTGAVHLSGENTVFDVTASTINQTIGDLTGSATSQILLGSNQLTFGTTNPTAQTFGGAISGRGGIVKQGTGIANLSGVNTYAGGTTINAGTLALRGTGSLLATGAVHLSGENTVFDVTASTIAQTIGDLTGVANSQILLVSNPLTFGTTNPTAQTFGGVISGSGGIVKQGTGTANLSGVNTYSGGTTINAGTLALSGTGSLVPTGAVHLSTGTTFDLTTSTVAQTIGDLTGVASSQILLGSNQLTFGTNTSSQTFNGVISGSDGKIVKHGTGTVILTGMNNYTGGTTVSPGGGILQGDTNSLKGDITNNATVVFDQTTNGTYKGVMSGGGGLVKSNTGTVILSGANSYGGGTIVSTGGGILQGDTNSLKGNITNDATVTFDQDFTGTYAGVMSGGGGLVKSNTGTVILKGDNSYTGGTTVSAGGGILQGDTTSLKRPITNNGTVTFDQDFTGTYAGVMSGTGALIKNGTGTVVLSGTHSYGGGTIVSGGILQGDTTSLQGPIVNNGTVTFDQSIVGTYAGVMSGTGSLIKRGIGITSLSGENTYSGTTKIHAGILRIAGSTTASAINVSGGAILHVPGRMSKATTTVDSGGLLIGAGSTGTLINSGMVSPGNFLTIRALKVARNQIDSRRGAVTPGGSHAIETQNVGSTLIHSKKGTISPGGYHTADTLTVNGSYTQNPGADLLINIDADGSSDLLNITGTADLAGELILNAGPGLYPTGSQFTFMNYASVTGNLTLIEDSSLQFFINYQGTFAELINSTGGAVLPISKSDLHGNPRAVADYLFCRNYFPSNPDLLNVMEALVNVPADQFAEDLVKLSPVQFGALPLVNLQSHRLIADVIAENTEKFFWCDPCHATESANDQYQANQKKTSIWIAPIGNYYDQDNVDGQTSFEAYSVGGGLGVTHLFFDCFHVGGSLGYTYSNIDWDDNRGKGHWNSIYVGPSLGWRKNNAYVNLLALGSYNYYDIDRNIHFPGVKRTASNKHHSYDVLGRLDGGYKFLVYKEGDRSRIFIQPEGRLSYLNIFEERYTESGADSINLTVDSKYSAFLQPTILVKFLRETYCSGYCLSQAIHVGWISNIPLSSGNYKSRFFKQETCQPHFVVKSFHDATNQLTVGGELVFRTDSDWIIELGYKADVFDNSTVQSGKLKVEKRF